MMVINSFFKKLHIFTIGSKPDIILTTPLDQVLAFGLNPSSPRTKSDQLQYNYNTNTTLPTTPPPHQGGFDFFNLK